MEDQKVNPVPSCRDTKMDKLLETLTEDFFYANDEKDATVSLDFKAGEPFRFQFFLTDDGMFHLTYKGRRVISNGLMIFYEPGLKGMLAFFYALELGCRNVWLEEYDYFDSYFRLKAATDKGTDSCVITFSDYEYGKSKVRKFKTSKRKSIGYFNRQMQKNFSNDELVLTYLREESDSSLTGPYISEGDVRALERIYGTINFVRTLPWIFHDPLPEIRLEDFLSQDHLAFFESWKKNAADRDEN